MFYFSACRPNLFKHLLTHTTQTVCDRCISRRNNTSGLFHQNTFSSTRKLLTPNMCCWFCKTFVTMYWTHLRVNGIWAKSY